VLFAVILQAGKATLFHQAFFGLKVLHHEADQVIETFPDFGSIALTDCIVERIYAIEKFLMLLVADVDVGAIILWSPFH
jgi:hypothetical protein